MSNNSNEQVDEWQRRRTLAREAKKKLQEIRLEKRQALHENQRMQLEAALAIDWPLFIHELDAALIDHRIALVRNFSAAYQKNEYGAIIKDERGSEIQRFLESVNLFNRAQAHGLDKSVAYVFRWLSKQIELQNDMGSAPIEGHDLEHWVAAQLVKAGWTASVTKASNDDGVDVVAERDGITVAVQCKRYAGSVGNKAVQEVYAGMKHLQLARAVVISTGQYTKAARSLASSTGVLLLSENDISHLWRLLSD